MIVDGNGDGFLGAVLADDMEVELAFDLGRFWDGELETAFGLGRAAAELLVEDALADVDAIVADVDARACDEFAHFAVGLPTEAAHRQVGRAGH
jgi:hypothetical protein